MAHIHSPVPSSPKRSRNEIQWDKCVIYQGSATELLINMQGISTNKSFIEAMGARKVLSLLHDASDLDHLRTDDYKML